jgi:hypothetical protein
MSFNDLGLRYSLWQRLRKCLLHDQSRASLSAALARCKDQLQQRTAIHAVIRAYEKRPLARSNVLQIVCLVSSWRTWSV